MLPVLNLVSHLSSVSTHGAKWLLKNYILSLTTKRLVYLSTDVLSTCVSLLFLTGVCGYEKLWKT